MHHAAFVHMIYRLQERFHDSFQILQVLFLLNVSMQRTHLAVFEN